MGREIKYDESIRSEIEPGASPTEVRFSVLKEFKKTNASTGLHLMPIIPYITDSEQNFEKIFSRAQECGVDYLLPGTLYLRGKTRTTFFEFLRSEYPEKNDLYSTLYKTGGANKEYKNKLYLMVNRLRGKYGLSSSYMKPMQEKLSIK